MNLRLFDLICISVGLAYIAYTVRRARRAVRSDRAGGFVLNPCFYLSGYAFLYLLLGTLISEAGQELYGFGFSDETRWLSNSLMLYYFFIFFGVYAVSDDEVIAFEKRISIKSLTIIRLVGIACLLIATGILVVHGPTLLSMSGDRNQVYAYFVEHIFYDLRYGTLINFMIVFFVCEYLRSKPAANPLRIGLFVFLPVLIIELLVGGRAVLLKVLLVVFIVTCLKKGKLYLRYLLYSFIALASIGLIQRFDVATVDLGQTALNALGELILTRTTTDIVIENGLSGSGYAYSISSMLSLLPGVVNTLSFPDSVNYIDVVTSAAGREYGVAGNIVSEAYYYGGLWFALISPFIISTCMYALNGARFTRHLPGFLFLMFVILGLQNMMRTSFYDQLPAYVYLMYSYFLFITLLDFGNPVLRGRRRGSIRRVPQLSPSPPAA